MAADTWKITFVAPTGDLAAYRRFSRIITQLEAARAKPGSSILSLDTYHESIDGVTMVRAESAEAAILTVSKEAPELGALAWDVQQRSDPTEFANALDTVRERAAKAEAALMRPAAPPKRARPSRPKTATGAGAGRR